MVTPFYSPLRCTGLIVVVRRLCSEKEQEGTEGGVCW